MATWPSTLPQRLQVDGAQFGLAENRLRSPVDIGPAKVRPLTSNNVEPMEGIMFIDRAQWSTLKTFVVTTLLNGTLAFDFPDPVNEGSTLLVRFADELPVVEPTGGLELLVRLRLEVLP